MVTIGAVHLRGGPCDGQRPEPLPGTAFPDNLDSITVMDHAAGVGHVYEVTDEHFTDDTGTHRTVLSFRATVESDFSSPELPGPPSRT
jgi:hypothetical protein